MKKSKAIPTSLKEQLAYDGSTPDGEVLEDWRLRTRNVCKPCWELKYCPYGPLVELSPALPPNRAEAEKVIDYYRRSLQSGRMGGSPHEITDEEKVGFENILRDEQMLFGRAIFKIEQEDRVETSLKTRDPVLTFLLGNPTPKVRMSKVDFHIDREHTELEKLDLEFRKRVETAMSEDRAALETALATGCYDSSEPLDPVRKMIFERKLDEFDAEDCPEECPEVFLDGVCNIFGHFCPVFFCAEAWTVTSEERRRGRYIPFDAKIRIVRRDNYTCQQCGVHLRDTEVEFDHIIPVAKGGLSEEHNIRLTCFDCNRDKSDSVAV